jgi:sorting nexin-3/12
VLYPIFQIVVPSLPGKAIKRQMPFRSDDGIFEEGFIEDRRKSLEHFINK